MAKKYLKNEKGLVRATTTETLQLEKPLGSENYDIEVHNRNMDKLDSEIKGLKGKVDGLELKAENVSIADSSNLFTSTNVEDALEELFQYANNGKKIIATAVGTPLVSSDTFSGLGTKIDELLVRFREVLTNKGQSPLYTDKLKSLIEMIPNISQSSVEGIEKLPSWHKPSFLDTWVRAANITTQRECLTSSVVNNMIYSIGGYDDYTYYKVNECYNPSSNTWTTKRNMTTAKGSLASSVVNNMIYVIGGDIYNSDDDYTCYNANECYNPSSNTWTTKKNMTTARGSLASSVVKNMIYVIGGYDYYDTFSLDKNECYNPSSNTWTTKRNMTTGRANIDSTVVDDKIYVIGGYDNSSHHLDVNECYNPSSNTWTTRASLPIARDGVTLSTVNGKIYAIGGCVNDELNHPVNINRCYNPTSNTWSTKKGMPTTRISSAASVVDNNIYIIGGWNHSSGLPSNEIYIV